MSLLKIRSKIGQKSHFFAFFPFLKNFFQDLAILQALVQNFEKWSRFSKTSEFFQSLSVFLIFCTKILEGGGRGQSNILVRFAVTYSIIFFKQNETNKTFFEVRPGNNSIYISIHFLSVQIN